MFKRDTLRAKKVIVEIIRQAGGSLTGATRLYKAFYFAHLFYADQEPDFLTDWPIVRMPHGPGIDEGDELLSELVATAVLRRSYGTVGPYPCTTYSLTEKEMPGDPLSAGAVAAIQKAAKFVQEKSATELSNLTHEHSRSWNKTPDGRELNIYIDAIADDEYEARRRHLEVLRSKIASAARRLPEAV